MSAESATDTPSSAVAPAPAVEPETASGEVAVAPSAPAADSADSAAAAAAAEAWAETPAGPSAAPGPQPVSDGTTKEHEESKATPAEGTVESPADAGEPKDTAPAVEAGAATAAAVSSTPEAKAAPGDSEPGSSESKAGTWEGDAVVDVAPAASDAHASTGSGAAKGEEGDKVPEMKPAGKSAGKEHKAAPASGWTRGAIVKLVIDFVVLSWCFILPLIAASQRVLDPNSGKTTCVYSVELSGAKNDTYTVDPATLDVNATCSGGSCSVQCTTIDTGVFLALSQGWKVALGLIPIVVVFEGILSFKLSSRYVAPFSMLYTVVLGSFFFRDSKFYQTNSTGGAQTLADIIGLSTLVVVDRFFWAIIEYVFNVFSAFFFMRVLELWGQVESMREEFAHMAKTPTRKVVVVGFCFAILLAVVAPGGSNYIVAGAILIEMNPSGYPKGPKREESNVRIGTLCLFGNALISAFNLLGICITTIAEDIQDLAYDTPNNVEYGGIQIGRIFSLQFFLFSLASPFIMAWLYCDAPGIKKKLAVLKPELPMLLGVGFVYSAAQLFTAWGIGPELPCLTAGGLSLLYYLLLENWGHIQCPTLKGRAYMLPFVVLITVLLVMRLVPYVEEGVTGDWGDDGTAASILNPWVWFVTSGGLKFKRTLPWLWHSGVIVAAIGCLTPFITPFRAPPLIKDKDALMSGLRLNDGTLTPYHPHSDDTATPMQKFKRTKLKLLAIAALKTPDSHKRRHVLVTALKEAVADVLPVVVSITSFASIAKLMDKFGMIQVIADFMVGGLQSVPSLYVLLMPFIGTLGSGLTGSTTTSNFLFGRLQVATAKELTLVAPGGNTVYEVAATNILGASAGEIIAPMNAVVITLMKGIGGTESRLIKRVLPLSLGWLVCTMVMSVIFIVPSGGFIN